MRLMLRKILEQLRKKLKTLGIGQEKMHKKKANFQREKKTSRNKKRKSNRLVYRAVAPSLYTISLKTELEGGGRVMQDYGILSGIAGSTPAK